MASISIGSTPSGGGTPFSALGSLAVAAAKEVFGTGVKAEIDMETGRTELMSLFQNAMKLKEKDAETLAKDFRRKMEQAALRYRLSMKEIDSVFFDLVRPALEANMSLDQAFTLAVNSARVGKSFRVEMPQVSKDMTALLRGQEPEGRSQLVDALDVKKGDVVRAQTAPGGAYAFWAGRLQNAEKFAERREQTTDARLTQLRTGSEFAAKGVLDGLMNPRGRTLSPGEWNGHEGWASVVAYLEKARTTDEFLPEKFIDAAKAGVKEVSERRKIAEKRVEAWLEGERRGGALNPRAHAETLTRLMAPVVREKEEEERRLAILAEATDMFTRQRATAGRGLSGQRGGASPQGGSSSASAGKVRGAAAGRGNAIPSSARTRLSAVNTALGREAVLATPSEEEDPAIKSQDALKESLKQTTEQVHAQADALEAQAAAEGKSKSELRALTIAQLEKQRADLEATESVIPGYIQELEKRIDAEKRMLRLEQAGEEATATKKRKDELKAEADKRTKEEGDKADKVAGDIQGGFRKAFVDAVNGADNVLENLGKSLQKTLTNAVADALYDALLEEPIKKFSKELSRAIRGLSGDKSEAASSSDGKGLSLEGGAAKMPGGGVEGGASGGAGGGFLSGIGDALSRMGGELWKTVESIGGTLKGALSGLLESFTKPSSGEGGSWFSAILGLLPFAKGGAFPAGTGLSAYASQIVDRPTLFPFAKGIGLMGEAGAEGILPLRRDAQGRLGVSASGVGMGGGGIVFSPTSVFHVDARSDRGAVIADMQRLLGNNNRAQMEHLQRLRVVPQS